MNEKLKRTGKYVTGGVVAIGLAAILNTDGRDSTNANSSAAVPSSFESDGQVLRGDKYTIRKIGKDVFKTDGDTQESAIELLSEKCDVLSVGAWFLTGHKIDQHAVVVEDGACMPELTTLSK